MNLASRAKTLLPVLACVGLQASLPAGATPVRIVETGPGADVFEYLAPGGVQTPGDAPGSVALAGFGQLREPGRPSLPILVQRVGLPEGAIGRLEILQIDETTSSGIHLPPVPRWVRSAPRARSGSLVYDEDPSIYQVDAFYPADAPVRLGRIGYLRDQRYLEIVLTPARFDPVRNELKVALRVRFRVTFEPAPSTPSSQSADRLGVQPSTQDTLVTAAAPAAGGMDASPSKQNEILRSLRLAGPARPDPPTPQGRGAQEEFDAGLLNPEQARGFLAAAVAPPPAVPETSALAANAAVSTVYKLTVNQDGIYRVDKAWVATNAPDLIGRSSVNFRLDCQGVQIPITVNDSDGTFNDSGDYVEFYGQKLAWDILDADSWDKGDFTDNNVYLLYAQSTPGLRIPTRDGAPTDTFVVPADYQETIHNEVGDRLLSEVPNDTFDHWVQNPGVFASGSSAQQAYTVTTPDPSTATTTASIKVDLLGDDYINNYHRTTIQVNGTTVKGPSDWDGFREFVQGQDDGAATFAQTLLSGTTTVTVSLPLGRTVNSIPITTDQVEQNWIEITYGRKFVVAQDALIFSVPNLSRQYKVTGLTNGANAVYEITNILTGTPLVNPTMITGVRVGGTSPNKTVEFQVVQDTSPGAPPTRRFAVVSITNNTSTGDLTPQAVEADVPSTLKSPSNGADWIVIADTSLLDSAGGSNWQQLLSRRASQGLRVKVVDIKDVYDEFSYSIFDPQAIRDFIAYAYFNWILPKPAEVILVGDATLDYKNGYGWGTQKQFVPTYMRTLPNDAVLGYYSDDVYFANVAGADDLPDVQLGRIPSHSVSETDAWARKVLDYETASIGPPNPAWMHNNVFVASSEDPAFESVQETQISNYLVGTANTWNRTYEAEILNANPGWTLNQVAAETRTRIQNQLNGAVDPTKDIGPGAVVLTFVGHGGWQNWADNSSIFTTASSGTDDLTPVNNPGKLPFLLAANCLTGGFAETSRPSASVDLTYGFGEDFVTTAAKGAIAVLGPSHLTFSFTQATALDAFFNQVYGPKKIRKFGSLALAVQLAFDGAGDVTALRSYSFLGDPHTSLPVPAPRPPTAVAASGLDRGATVSWTASPDAASYHIYRSDNSGGPYLLAGTSPSSPFTDSGLTNCITQYYLVTAVDSGGFESAWSNFNDGCGTGGPCVSAVPRKSTPPGAPTGVTATDAGSGGTVHVSWSPNPPSDEAGQYTVYGRSAPGPYTLQVSAGAGTSMDMTGLTNGVQYFFAVSATNCSQGEGPKSAESSATPNLVQGIRPPRMIGDLRVQRHPDPVDHIDDTLLTWTPPTQDLYGGPVTLASQEVYAGSTPLFPLDTAHRLTVLSATATSYIHPNGFGDAGNHYYVVVAVDSAGNRSGASRDLPQGISNLSLTRSGGNITLQWTSITKDFDGNPTVIDHYDLYADSVPFSRSGIGPSRLLVGGITGSSVTIAIPSGTRYYSVIAVDQRGQQSPW